MSENLADDGDDFAALMGAFGSHANTERRAKAERMAALKKDDKRRKREVTRPHQFNVRIDDDTLALTRGLIEKFAAKEGRLDKKGELVKPSQADIIILAVAALAKAEKVRVGA